MVSKNLHRLRRLIRKPFKQSKTVIVAYHICDNFMHWLRRKLGNYHSAGWVRHSGLTTEESLKYIERTVSEYLSYMGVAAEWLVGKRVLEVGPLDNFGVALSLLSHGAKSVATLDKFTCQRNIAQEREIYSALRERLDAESQQRFDDAVDLTAGVKFNEKRFKYISGIGIEDAESVLEPCSFDLIVSAYVLEHLSDPAAGFSSMYNLLSTGGNMVHKIGFHDHGIFRADTSHHALTYLTIPKFIYTLMSKDSGKPNRKLIDYFERQMVVELGLKLKLFITGVYDADGGIVHFDPYVDLSRFNGQQYSQAISVLEKIRPSLAGEFQCLPSEVLIATGVLIVATKS